MERQLKYKREDSPSVKMFLKWNQSECSGGVTTLRNYNARTNRILFMSGHCRISFCSIQSLQIVGFSTTDYPYYLIYVFSSQYLLSWRRLTVAGLVCFSCIADTFLFLTFSVEILQFHRIRKFPLYFLLPSLKHCTEIRNFP